MRTLTLSLVTLLLTGCLSSQQIEAVSPVVASVHEAAVLTKDTSKGDSPAEVEVLYNSLRVPAGWRVGNVSGNYVDFRSGQDSAYMMIWDDTGEVEWRVTYHTGEGTNEMRCYIRSEGSQPDSETGSYQVYLDDLNDPVMVHSNWPDIDAVNNFETALALREGGSCIFIRWTE